MTKPATEERVAHTPRVQIGQTIIFLGEPDTLICECCIAEISLADFLTSAAAQGWSQSGRSRRIFRDGSVSPAVFASWCPSHKNSWKVIANPSERECTAIFLKTASNAIAHRTALVDALRALIGSAYHAGYCSAQDTQSYCQCGFSQVLAQARAALSLATQKGDL